MRVTSSHFRAQEFQVRIFGGLQFQNGQAAGAGDAKKIQDSRAARRSAQAPVCTPARSLPANFPGKRGNGDDAAAVFADFNACADKEFLKAAP
jgi:hypothetical protein